jgi:RNA polymerase sigma-70 factor, ECF subfamily
MRLALQEAYRTEARRVLATLIRLLGSFDAAEDALHEAFTAAAEQWPQEGVPDNPHAWLVHELIAASVRVECSQNGTRSLR